MIISELIVRLCGIIQNIGDVEIYTKRNGNINIITTSLERSNSEEYPDCMEWDSVFWIDNENDCDEI